MAHRLLAGGALLGLTWWTFNTYGRTVVDTVDQLYKNRQEAQLVRRLRNTDSWTAEEIRSLSFANQMVLLEYAIMSRTIKNKWLENQDEWKHAFSRNCWFAHANEQHDTLLQLAIRGGDLYVLQFVLNRLEESKEFIKKDWLVKCNKDGRTPWREFADLLTTRRTESEREDYNYAWKYDWHKFNQRILDHIKFMASKMYTLATPLDEIGSGLAWAFYCAEKETKWLADFHQQPDSKKLDVAARIERTAKAGPDQAHMWASNVAFYYETRLLWTPRQQRALLVSAIAAQQYPFAQALIDSGVDKPMYDSSIHSLFDANFTTIYEYDAREIHHNPSTTTFDLDYMCGIPDFSKVFRKIDADHPHFDSPWAVWVQQMTKFVDQRCPHTNSRFETAAFGGCDICTRKKFEMLNQYKHLKDRDPQGWINASSSFPSRLSFLRSPVTERAVTK